MATTTIDTTDDRPARDLPRDRQRRPGRGHRQALLGGNVAVKVTNLDHAIGFYCGALGLRLRLRVGDTWAEVQTSGLTIGLLADADLAPSMEPEGRPAIGFEVDDLTAKIRELRHDGVELDAIEDQGRVRIVPFRDPDRNPLYLCEVRGGPGAYLP